MASLIKNSKYFCEVKVIQYINGKQQIIEIPSLGGSIERVKGHKDPDQVIFRPSLSPDNDGKYTLKFDNDVEKSINIYDVNFSNSIFIVKAYIS